MKFSTSGKPTFAMIHPSRGRPHLAFHTYQSIIQKAKFPTEIEYIIALDQEDQTGQEYVARFREYPQVKIHISPTVNCVQALNAGAAISTGDILCYVCEDFDFPKEWDVLFLGQVMGKKDWVLWVTDGVQDRIMTSCILDRTYYERDMFIYNPVYQSMYADNEYTAVAVKRERIIQARHLRIIHRHFTVEKRQPDATDLRQNESSRYHEGQKIFEARQRAGFPKS